MNEEMLEILIGKSIDSEITPAEQRLLDVELKNNPEAKQLFQELQTLKDQASYELQNALDSDSPFPREHFDNAWREHHDSQDPSTLRFPAWQQTIISAAACFLIALGIFQMIQTKPIKKLPVGTTHAQMKQSQQPINFAQKNNVIVDKTLPPRLTPKERTSPYIDWYIVTTPSGTQYIYETHRNQPSDITTASYQDGI